MWSQGQRSWHSAVLPGILMTAGRLKGSGGGEGGCTIHSSKSRQQLFLRTDVESLFPGFLTLLLSAQIPSRSFQTGKHCLVSLSLPSWPPSATHTLSAGLQKPVGTSPYVSHFVLPSFKGLYGAAISQGKRCRLTVFLLHCDFIWSILPWYPDWYGHITFYLLTCLFVLEKVDQPYTQNYLFRCLPLLWDIHSSRVLIASLILNTESRDLEHNRHIISIVELIKYVLWDTQTCDLMLQSISESP